MKTVSLTIVTFLTSCFLSSPQLKADEVAKITVNKKDWQFWRGPNRNGIARSQQPPTNWSETDNILWRTPVPGRGHSSPIVYGDLVVLATSTKEAQSVIAFDRKTGKVRWTTPVHEGKVPTKMNKKSTNASGTVAIDGTQIYVSFVNGKPNGGALYTTALNLAGDIQWQRRIHKYLIHQGYGASPVIYGNLVLVTADNKGKGGGAVAALDRNSGKIVWKKKRPATPNYSSFSPLHLNGRDQMLLEGCGLITSFDPLTGNKLWEIKGSTTECVTTMVSDGTLVFSSGGYPRNHVQAVRASDQKTVWQKTTRVYVPSMVVYKGHLFAVTDAGVAYCWKSSTGETAWKSRLGGVFTSSLTLAGDNFFATNEKGTTFVFKASTERFNRVSRNQLGDACYASPAFAGNKIFTRVVGRSGGKRQEYLVCIGN